MRVLIVSTCSPGAAAEAESQRTKDTTSCQEASQGRPTSGYSQRYLHHFATTHYANHGPLQSPQAFNPLNVFQMSTVEHIKLICL